MTHPRLPSLETIRLVRQRMFVGPSLLCFAIGIIVLVPLVALQLRALADNGQGYLSLITEARLREVVVNTIAVAVGSVGIALVMGILLGWASYQLPDGARIISVIPLIPLMMPPLATVSGWIFLTSPKVGILNVGLRKLPGMDGLTTGPFDVYTLPWIILITGISLTSFVYLFIFTSLRNLDGSLIEASRINGAGGLRTFAQVVIPLLRPAIIYSATIVLLLGLGQFTVPLFLGRQHGIDVATTEMNRAMNSFPVDFGLAAAYGSPLLIVGAILIAAQRWALRESSKFEMLGAKGRRTAKSKMKAWQLSLFIGYIGLTVLLPLAALIIVSLSPYWAGDIPVQKFSLANYEQVFTDSAAIDSITTTMKSVAITLVIVIPVGYFAAAALASSGNRHLASTKLLDILVNVPLAMPAIIFGVGILFAYTEGPLQLYGTVVILIVAYVTIMIPHVTRMQLSGMTAMGDRLTDASRSSGAGLLRTHAKVVIPLMRPSIAGATGLAVALLTHEFAASITVRGPGVQVMGTKLYDYYDLGQLPEVAVMAVTMVVVTGLSISAALMFGGRRAFDQ